MVLTMGSTIQPSPNPTVLFEKGLLTVRVEGVDLNTLMGEIAKKAGMAVRMSPYLESFE